MNVASVFGLGAAVGITKLPDADKRERAIRDITDMIHMLDDAVLAARIGAGDLRRNSLISPLSRAVKRAKGRRQGPTSAFWLRPAEVRSSWEIRCR